MNKVLCFLLLLLGSRLVAQISQPNIFEKEHKRNDHEFIVIPMGEKGITLLRNTEKFDQKKRIWELIVLDTSLHETWNINLNVDNFFDILGHDYRDENIYLLYRQSDQVKGDLILVELDLKSHSVREHLFKPEVDVSLTHFYVIKNVAIFGGYVSKEPAILLYDMQNENAKILPGTYAPHLELLDLRSNVNDTFNALLTERRSKNEKKLIIRTYDANGLLLVEDEIKLENEKTILSGITSTLLNDEMIVVGTWTEGTGNQAAGIFSVMVDPFKEQEVNYYEFPGLKHFLDYQGPKKAERIRSKAEWRRSVGKPVEFRAYVSSVKIDESKTGFSFLSEVFIPAPNNNINRWGPTPYGTPYPYYYPYGISPYGFSPMQPRYYSPYSPYASPYGNSYIASDTRIQHSSLLFFDLKGKLVNDCGLSYDEIKLPSKEQVSDYITRNGVTTFTCHFDKDIILKQTDLDGSVIRDDKIKIALTKPEEEIRSESSSGTIRSWYQNCFYAFGYHSIKNNLTRESRDVFYINKLKID